MIVYFNLIVVINRRTGTALQNWPCEFKDEWLKQKNRVPAQYPSQFLLKRGNCNQTNYILVGTVTGCIDIQKQALGLVKCFIIVSHKRLVFGAINFVDDIVHVLPDMKRIVNDGGFRNLPLYRLNEYRPYVHGQRHGRNDRLNPSSKLYTGNATAAFYGDFWSNISRRIHWIW